MIRKTSLNGYSIYFHVYAGIFLSKHRLFDGGKVLEAHNVSAHKRTVQISRALHYAS